MTSSETLEALEELGFKNQWEDHRFPHGEYFDQNLSKRISLKPDGIYAYSVGSQVGEDYLEMYLNFIPDKDLLINLLSKVFYL